MVICPCYFNLFLRGIKTLHSKKRFSTGSGRFSLGSAWLNLAEPVLNLFSVVVVARELVTLFVVFLHQEAGHYQPQNTSRAGLCTNPEVVGICIVIDLVGTTSGIRR